MASVKQANEALEDAYLAAATEMWRQVEAGETPALSAGDTIFLLAKIAEVFKTRQRGVTRRQKAHANLRKCQSSIPRFLEEMMTWKADEKSASELLTERLGRPPSDTELSTYKKALGRNSRHYEMRCEGLGYCGQQGIRQWPELAAVERRLDHEVP